MDIKKTTSGLLILTQLLPVWHPLAHAALPTPSLTTDSQNNTENRFSVATMATGAALQADDQSGALKTWRWAIFPAQLTVKCRPGSHSSAPLAYN